MSSVNQEETLIVTNPDNDKNDELVDNPLLVTRRTLFKIAVNPTVNYGNFLAIPLITTIVMMITTF